MNTKSDWQAANRELLDERRRALEPPTSEQVMAYSLGELSAAEEADVRERLTAYPELMRTLAAPFPDAAAAGDADHLTDEEFDRLWQSPRRPQETRNVVPIERPFWKWTTAIAAALALTFGVLLWGANERRDPLATTQVQILHPDGSRGAEEEATPVFADNDVTHLALSLTGVTRFPTYRVELRTAAGRVTWTSEPMDARKEDETISVMVPHELLNGRAEHRFVLYGVGGSSEEELATYSFAPRGAGTQR